MINQYIDILRQKVLPFIEYDQLFQQDLPNAINRPRFILFEEEAIALLPDWPARSPDFNIIENLCDYLKIQVSKHNIPNLQGLRTIVQTEFFKIADSFIKNWFDSRIDAVIKNKGHLIRY